MTAALAVRRVHLHEWREIRDLRIDAVSDPAARVAFLSTRDEELARDDAFWQERAARAALSDQAAQFVASLASVADRWIGTVTVLLRDAGAEDHLGRAVDAPRADVVGVFVRPEHRGSGVLDALVDAAAHWAASHGADALTLDVHEHNARARAAYHKLGFTPTGEHFTSVIGPELVMRRESHRDSRP
ncbi:GNAT family N-acetyltransferase [Microbacterium sp.]|uniref:GNAT family N-acetyltransferase n=1 Tax=Microbacterium sp. TaxID=51671 RepID=UPI003C75C8AE